MATNSAQKADSNPACLSESWTSFAEKLTAVMAALKEDQFLVISVKRSNRFIQFAAQGAFGMRVETTSNAFLVPAEQLDAGQIAFLSEAGWKLPTGRPDEATPETDPDGSPNFFVDYTVPVPFRIVADLAVHTFANILRVPHPGFLAYELSDANGSSLLLPELGLKHAEPSQEEELPQLLLATLRTITGIADLEFDASGQVLVRCDNVVATLSLTRHPAHVRIGAVLVKGVVESPGILARLNELNAGLGLLRLFLRRGGILAIAEVPALPFVSNHVAQALEECCQLTNGIDSLLQAEFGGETSFSLCMPSVLKH